MVEGGPFQSGKDNQWLDEVLGNFETEQKSLLSLDDEIDDSWLPATITLEEANRVNVSGVYIRMNYRSLESIMPKEGSTGTRGTDLKVGMSK